MLRRRNQPPCNGKKVSAGRDYQRGNRRRFTANTHNETVRSYPTISNGKGVIP
ncbi:hypothetical protein BN191_370021 [Clostridioides difficile T61]|nr:hypothetical protein BN184_1110039 [Clostridioides difficile T3]CCL94501.1 hypothetical protein BN191_370021 [Clostridioides difficile T61]